MNCLEKLSITKIIIVLSASQVGKIRNKEIHLSKTNWTKSIIINLETDNIPLEVFDVWKHDLHKLSQCRLLHYWSHRGRTIKWDMIRRYEIEWSDSFSQISDGQCDRLSQKNAADVTIVALCLIYETLCIQQRKRDNTRIVVKYNYVSYETVPLFYTSIW